MPLTLWLLNKRSYLHFSLYFTRFGLPFDCSNIHPRTTLGKLTILVTPSLDTAFRALLVLVYGGKTVVTVVGHHHQEWGIRAKRFFLSHHPASFCTSCMPIKCSHIEHTVFYGIPDHDGIPDHFPRLCTGEEISVNRTSKHILKAS